MLQQMDYKEFQRQLGKAGLKTCEFAALLQMSTNSLTNYAKAGEVPSHHAVIAVLMAEMAEHGLEFRDAISKIKIEPKKPRGAAASKRFGGRPQEARGLDKGGKRNNE